MNVSSRSIKAPEAKMKKKRRQDALVDIRIRREVLWVTTNIDRVLGLIHPNPVNPHLRRERQVVGIDEASKVGRHAQVHDEVLSKSKAPCQHSASKRNRTTGKVHTIGSCGIGLAAISTRVSAANPPWFSVHAFLSFVTQVIYYKRKVCKPPLFIGHTAKTHRAIKAWKRN